MEEVKVEGWTWSGAVEEWRQEREGGEKGEGRRKWLGRVGGGVGGGMDVEGWRGNI